MNLKDVFFSESHLISPFKVSVNSTNVQFSTIEKVASVALSILIGLFTAGIGGIIAFYLITAAIKAKKLNNFQSTSEIITPFCRLMQVKTPQKSVEERRVPEAVEERRAPESTEYNVENPPLSSYPKSIQERKFPPVSAVDTTYIVNGEWKSAHSIDKFYQDNEILQLHPPIETIYLAPNIAADITDNGKVVIQQQATRGCSAGAAAMLIYDSKKPVNIDSLRNTNIGNTENIKRWMTEAGLTPRITKLDWKGLPSIDVIKNLEKLISKHGSAIVSTCNDIGNHYIVVDEVNLSLNSIRLRDPYHGWAITVTVNAFIRGFDPRDDIIQIDQ